MARLREAGHELDAPVHCHVGDQVGVMVATLDRAAVVEYADGHRRRSAPTLCRSMQGTFSGGPRGSSPAGYESTNDQVAPRPARSRHPGVGTQDGRDRRLTAGCGGQS